MKVVSVNKLEKSKVELEIEVSAEEFKAAVDKAAKKVLPTIAINGFRKGKAPRYMVEKLFGKEIFYEEAVNLSYADAYDAAIGETKIEPINMPELEIIKVDEEGYTFKARVEVSPEVKLGKYKELEAEKVAVKVTAAEVNKELENIRARHARLVDVTDREAKNGDTVTIDYSGSVDGVKFDGGTAEKQELKLGSGQFIPGFEEQVAGHKIGESFDVNVTFPKEYHADELAGKAAVFAVTLHAITETVLPELDDEFVKDISADFETLKDYKADLKKKIMASKETTASTELENELIEKAVNAAKVDVADVLVERQLDRICQDYDYRLRAQGLSLEQYLSFMGGMNMEQFRSSMREQAEQSAKTLLVLKAIVKKEKITIDEETLNNQYEILAAQYGMEVEDVRASIPVGDLESDLSINKAIELIRESAVVTTVEKKAEKTEEPANKPAAKKSTSTTKKTTSSTAKKTTSTAAKKPADKKTTTAKKESK